MPAVIVEAKERGGQRVSYWGTGSPLCEFLHVDDLGNACVFALGNWSAHPGDAPKNDQGKLLAFLTVGTGVEVTIKELAEQIAVLVGFEGTIEWDSSKPDGTPKKQLNVSRMKRLRWGSYIPLREGLASTVLLLRQE